MVESNKYLMVFYKLSKCKIFNPYPMVPTQLRLNLAALLQLN